MDNDPVKTCADKIHLTLFTHDWREDMWFSEEDWWFVQRVVREGFSPLLVMATDTPGFLMVSRACRLIESLLKVGLYVPRPVNVRSHVTRVIDNTFDVFYDLMEADLNTVLRPAAMRQLNF